jgi:penicillin amidase
MWGLRAGQITARIKDVLARRRMRFEDVQSTQADNTLRDAKLFLPHDAVPLKLDADRWGAEGVERLRL